MDLVLFTLGTEEEVKETILPNVAWVEVSPCGCDLTRGMCDLFCCCDKVNTIASLHADAFHGFTLTSSPQVTEVWLVYKLWLTNTFVIGMD